MARVHRSHSWGRRRLDRARERELAAADAEQISDLHTQWRNACTPDTLGRTIYTPSGVSIAIPLIKYVDLGPPIRFTVQMRPGQTYEQFVRTAPAIASAMNVQELQVSRHHAHWVRIVIVPR